jgi:hypothetical protein
VKERRQKKQRFYEKIPRKRKRIAGGVKKATKVEVPYRISFCGERREA